MHIEVVTLDGIDAVKFLYNGGMPKDISLNDRIRFFSFREMSCLGKDQEFYSFLMTGKKIIGIAHVGYYSMNAKNKNNWAISYLSIDKDYRMKGYSTLLVEEVFREAQKRDLEISTSSYTVLGKEHLQKRFNAAATKFDVIFYDKTEEDYLIDAEWMYTIIDGKKLHNDECNGWDKRNKIKSFLF